MVAKTRELDVVNINLATGDDLLQSKIQKSLIQTKSSEISHRGRR